MKITLKRFKFDFFLTFPRSKTNKLSIKYELKTQDKKDLIQQKN